MRCSESFCCILTRHPLSLGPLIHLHEYITCDNFVCLPRKLHCYFFFLNKIPNSEQSLNLTGSQLLYLCNWGLTLGDLSALEFCDGLMFSLQILFTSFWGWVYGDAPCP